MGSRDRRYESHGSDADFDDQRDTRNWGSNRGFGEGYRGYTRGYNMNREPNYKTETNRGYTGSGQNQDENYGRDFDREYSRDDSRDFTRTSRNRGGESFYGQGPVRSHLRCRDIMTRKVTTCQLSTPITEVARLMRDEDVGALPVIAPNGKLAGIITDRDLVVKGLNLDKNEAELTAEDCMTDDLFTANQNDRLVDVIHDMGDHQVRRVPVVDSRERLVGIISMADVAVQTNKDMELNDALENISQPSSWFGRLANLFHW